MRRNLLFQIFFTFRNMSLTMLYFICVKSDILKFYTLKQGVNVEKAATLALESASHRKKELTSQKGSVGMASLTQRLLSESLRKRLTWLYLADIVIYDRPDALPINLCSIIIHLRTISFIWVLIPRYPYRKCHQ